MNQVYRIVWNASRQAWMVAAELTRGKTKSQVGRKKTLLKMISSSLLVSTSLAFTGNAVAAPNEYIWDVQDGDWTTGSNWLGGIAPDDFVSNSEIIIDNVGEATISNEIIDLQMGENNLIVGKGGLREGTLVIQNLGQLRTGNLNIGQDSYSLGTVLVTNDARLSLQNPGSTFYVGDHGDAVLTVNNGAVVSTDLINVAVEAGSKGTINIGADRNETAAMAGGFDVHQVVFGDGNGTLVFNHTNGDLQFRSSITGKGNIELYNGTTRFTYYNQRFFAGNMQVKGGVLSIDSGNSLNLGSTDFNNIVNYEQAANARLLLGVFNMDNYAKLNVSGTATFAKDTGLDINAASASSLTMGGSLSSVISAGKLDASTFDLKDSSAIYDFNYQIDDNAVNLIIVAEGLGGKLVQAPSKDNSKGSAVLNSVNNQGFTPGRGAAQVLDGFVNSGITGTDIENVTTALGQLSTQQQVSDAVAETLPLLVAGTTGLASNTMRGTNRVIQSRQASNRGLSSGDEFLVDKAVWLKPVGSWSRQQ